MSKKLQKKQARAKSVKEKLLKERTVREYERKQERYAHNLNEMMKQKKVPYVRGNDVDEETARLVRDLEIKNQLEHNMKILEMLQEEIDQEKSARQELNERLEQEGNSTLQEKMEALAEQPQGEV